LQSYLYSIDTNRNKIKLFKLLYEKFIKNTDVPNENIEIVLNSYKYLEDDVINVTSSYKSVQNSTLNLLIDEYFKKKN